MESMLRDSMNNEVIAAFTDREKATVALFNTQDFTAYGNIYQIIDFWTKNVVSVLDKVKQGEPVKGKPMEKFKWFN
jgi:hypothetical protein